MEKMWNLFAQLDSMGQKNMDFKAAQDYCIMANQLATHATALHQSMQRDLTCYYNNSFFKDADFSNQFSYGQCGDHVYWKIIEDVLYIGGNGPMWDFYNSPMEFGKRNVASPWCLAYFHTVVIFNGVTTIGSDAFNGAEISSLIIPNSVKTIKECAFFDATIEQLDLPATIETVEGDILSGFSRVVDTLFVSLNIANPLPNSFFNRDSILANTIVLTGTLPKDLKPWIDSCIFDDAAKCKIYYPENWDKEDKSFCENIIELLDDVDTVSPDDLRKSLIPHSFV